MGKYELGIDLPKNKETNTKKSRLVDQQTRRMSGLPAFLNKSSHPRAVPPPDVVDAWKAPAPIDKVARKYRREVIRRARRRRIYRFRSNPRIIKAVSLGALSAMLYTLLFLNERLVLELSAGHWYSFLVPVAIALTFSFVHGSFTGAFWDAIGLRPHTVRK